MKAAAPRIALADDQALVRAGLRALLEQQGIVVAFEADDGEALLQQLGSTPVDVVLSDIRMPGVDGIDALRRLRERGDDALHLAIEDDGRLRGPLRPGNGLAGMRERIEGEGGRIAFATGRGGALRIDAWWPA